MFRVIDLCMGMKLGCTVGQISSSIYQNDLTVTGNVMVSPVASGMGICFVINLFTRPLCQLPDRFYGNPKFWIDVFIWWPKATDFLSYWKFATSDKYVWLHELHWYSAVLRIEYEKKKDLGFTCLLIYKKSKKKLTRIAQCLNIDGNKLVKLSHTVGDISL